MTVHSISISTLSPIHIGCGMDYEPSNFVIHDGLLHALDESALAGTLTDIELKHLADMSVSHDAIPKLQAFFKNQASRFAEVAHHRAAVVSGIVEEYAQKAGHPVQRGSAGQPVYSMFPIARTAFAPYRNTPYIPGSSIKGSIRTAWLNQKNKGNALMSGKPQDKAASRQLQEKLLGYTANALENDPFRLVRVSDAMTDEDESPPPTLVMYAISKKKRISDRGSPELRVFLETVPDAIPGRFSGDLRLDKQIDWPSLCQACNDFYGPQLAAELDHHLLGDLLDPEWKRLMNGLMHEEMAELQRAKQGFLLRIGRHSGAESVTLDGVRDIKILGKQGEPPTFRPETTEKRFASQTKAGADNLLPFGWVWVELCNGSHQSAAGSLRAKLAKRSGPMLEAHADRLARREAAQQERVRVAQEAELAREVEVAAQAMRAQQKAAMTPGLLAVTEFVERAANRLEGLRGNKEKLNAEFHNHVRTLAQKALAETEWSPSERTALADAIGEWLPKIVSGIDKEQLKKLKLSSLRGN